VKHCYLVKSVPKEVTTFVKTNLWSHSRDTQQSANFQIDGLQHLFRRTFSFRKIFNMGNIRKSPSIGNVLSEYESLLSASAKAEKEMQQVCLEIPSPNVECLIRNTL
jgi:hypothetical protein